MVGSKQVRCQEPEIRKQNGPLDSSCFRQVGLVWGSSVINADNRVLGNCQSFCELETQHDKPGLSGGEQ